MTRRSAFVALTALVCGLGCTQTTPPGGGSTSGTGPTGSSAASNGGGASSGGSASNGGGSNGGSATSGGGSTGSGSSSNGGSGGGSAGVAGHVFALNGAPIAGAQVSFSTSAQTTTASDGSYHLAAAAGSIVLDVEASGYVQGGRPLTLAAGEMATLDFFLAPATPPQTLDATAGGTITGPRGASIVLPGGALVDANGATVTGPVQASITPLTPGYPGELLAYPGDMRGVDSSGNVSPLATAGALGIQITQNGQKLELGPGRTAQVTIPASLLGNPLPTVGMYYFDHATGLWTLNGTFTLDGGVYTGVSNHFSSNNCDCPSPPFCVEGTLVDCGGNPIHSPDGLMTVLDDQRSYLVNASVPANFQVGLPAQGGTLDGGKSGGGGGSSSCRGLLPILVTTWTFNASWQGLLYSVQVSAGPGNAPNGVCDSTANWVNLQDVHPLNCGSDGGASANGPGAGGPGGAPPGGLLGIGDAGPCELWPVDGGFEIGDSGTVVADPFAGTCAAPLTRFFECTQTSGTCTESQPLPDGPATFTFANGAAETLSILGAQASIAYTNGQGQSCGTIVASGSGAVEILLDDDTVSYAVSNGLVICPDGGYVTMAPDQEQAAQACSPMAAAFSGPSACTMPAVLGTPCQSAADCGGVAQTICCMSGLCSPLCLPAQVCAIYPSEACCPANPCTTSGDVCCPEQGVGFSLCVPAAGCASSPVCGAGSPCADGGVCCTPASTAMPVCLPPGGFCPSRCTVDAGTGAGGCPAGASCCEAVGADYSECVLAGTACPPACASNADCSDGGVCCFPVATSQVYGLCTILGDGGPSGPAACPTF
ncbi:MAG TPA: carboxypeptidase-like regulatory domain-containing protein [Myxococcales bacterium]|nr:carboxypeptidase-like regulatory domain-containing protein [Myxococcales bacterium]